MTRTQRTIRRPRTVAFSLWAMLGLGLCSPLAVAAADAGPTNEFLEFIRAQASALRAGDKPPASREAWQQQNEAIRRGLREAWGRFPAEPCPLEPRTLGTLKRDGYTVEKVVFQTRPGVWMTANAYVPDRPGKLPAILQVHGHWKGAKQDPVVQSRCIGAAKVGFFVLAVDAFGAGERGIGKALGEYHGEMTGATLFPVGLPLSGLQVYENMRAVDYLRTRPEVDGERIGITGASGGGNQTMYAGAWDERLGAAVPVCSVGNYGAYLGGACCMCEVVPGAVRFTEEWGVLALTAPRGLMVVSATGDAPQFSVQAAKKSIAGAEAVFRLFDRPGHLRHAIFESGHDYNHAMREAMYGWMTLHLKHEGDGSPIAEPAFKTEDPETLRCFPGDSRPNDWVTLPRFAAEEARKILAARATTPKDPAEWRASADATRKTLVGTVFGGFPDAPAAASKVETAEGARIVHFEPEPGIHLSARVEPGKEPNAPSVVLIDLDGAEKAVKSALAGEVRKAGWGLVTLDLRATGKHAWPSDLIGRAPDHNSAEWALWIGRPLIGQWAFDVRRLLDALEKLEGGADARVVLVGLGPGGLVALSAGATDPRVSAVAAVDTLASFVTAEPYTGQRLGVMAPGILRTVGDVAHLAALNAPRPVVIAGGISGAGKPLALEDLREAYRPASAVWGLLGVPGGLAVLEKDDAAVVIRALP
ncbi:MAG: acetylxylan esterase [Isosphaeraceae bacterium]|nr:acetylxylan esterase [Isosphaeraceae bacterium]